jgi:asparagine N-glycosylation enzyme membrane subunit Stt3
MEEDNVKINLGRIFPNRETALFAALLLASLLLSIFSASGINLGITALAQFISIFPGILLWTLTIALAISAACAYFGKFKWIFLPLIIWLILATVVVRTSNISMLKDITTGDWSLAPDLDPFLYLRNAGEIISGTLQNPDMMRAAPLGAENYALHSLMPWFIVGLYEIMSLAGNASLTYSAIILPVILFSISAIGFLLFMRTLSSFKLSKKKSWICAILATLFYVFMPDMLHRTVAGVPEIESLGMAWFWFAFMFFIMAWKEQSRKKMISYGMLAGVFTGLMAWSWGGYKYIYLIIGLASLLIFMFQKDRAKNRIIYSSWAIPALLITYSQVRDLGSILTSVSDTGFGIFVLFLLLLDFIMFDTKLKEKIKLEKINLPKSVTSLLAGIAIAIIFLLATNASLLTSSISTIFERLLYPFGRERVGLTVAENAVPSFMEILQNFGYLFLVFIAGIIIMFSDAVRKFSQKKRWALTGFFALFVVGFIFSKYSPSSSILNGDSFISKLIYLGSLAAFGIAMLYMLVKAHIKKDEKTAQDFREIEIEYILLFAFAFWEIISMRGAIRLLFIISPVLPIISSFLLMGVWDYKDRNKENSTKKISAIILLLVLAIIMAGAFVAYSEGTVYTAENTFPGTYEHQWQEAMSWARNETPANSIFVSWWDYGYWIQTLGERATVTDGGHPIAYWNHLIGRYVLTTPYPETALSFMKAHDVSYLLIDSTDLGKYGAYSSIGSDATGMDRLAQIPIMPLDASQSRSTNVSDIRIYTGGVYVDQDIIYGTGENQVFLPQNNAGIAGIALEISKESGEASQPNGIFIYNQKQITIPIRYLSYNGKMTDFGGGLDAVVKIIPSITQSGTSANIDYTGTAIYLSPKVSKSLFAQIYLLDDASNEYPTLQLAHEEPDPLINSLNQQGAHLGEFAYFNDFRGPIKIWKVSYPINIIGREEFLNTSGAYAEFDNLTFFK